MGCKTSGQTSQLEMYVRLMWDSCGTCAGLVRDLCGTCAGLVWVFYLTLPRWPNSAKTALSSPISSGPLRHSIASGGADAIAATLSASLCRLPPRCSSSCAKNNE